MQTAGRAARNVEGEVILYADKMTDSMKAMIGETNRRRKKQLQYNEDNGITPETIYKTREEILQATSFADSRVAEAEVANLPDFWEEMPVQDKISFLSQQMEHAAAELEFERAADLRDQIMQLKDVTKKKARR